ncbi:DUF6531 domain-containing protein [Kitasatospora griseola]|uniref:DUF6531 domain-containing protein n=1 Tax=Kitasatospora griseola TaxID=2064 RepID=UPI00381749F4
MKHLARRLGTAALSAALIAGVIAPAASARPLAATAAVRVEAPPTATPPPVPMSMAQKRDQATKQSGQPIPHRPGSAMPHVAGPDTPGYRQMTADEVAAAHKKASAPTTSVAPGQASASWTGSHPYINNLSYFPGDIQGGNTGLAWCISWDFDPNTPSNLTNGGMVTVQLFRDSDGAQIDAMQWRVFQSTGYCEFKPLDRDTLYWAMVTYYYPDGTSDSISSTAERPTPIYGVPANVSLACPGSPASTGIVLELVKYCGDPVNTSTGAFGEVFTDAQVPGPGQSIQLTRSYSSSLTASGVFGKGWAFPYSAWLNVGQSLITFHAEDGSQSDYKVNVDGSIVPTRSYIHSALQKIASGYRLTTPEQHQLLFDSTGRLTAMRDPAGVGVTLAYTGSQLTSVTDAGGHAVIFTYTSGLLTNATLPGSRSVAYGYTSGRLTSATDLRGKTTKFGYDATSGLLTTVTDPLGNVRTTNVYDSGGRVKSQTDSRGFTTTFAYDAANPGTTYVTYPDGGIWTLKYTDGVISWQSDPYGKVTSYGYDQNLNRTSLTDANGNKATFTPDANGNVLTSTSPAPTSAVDIWTYDSANRVTTHKDARNNTVIYTYNSLNQLTQTTDPAGGKTTYTYNALNQLATVTSPRNGTTTYGYDSAGNRASATTPLGEKTTFGYDAAGRVTSKTDPRGNAAGAKASDFTTIYAYDASGLLTSATDPIGNATTYVYDADGQLITVTDALGHVTTYGYDSEGHRATVTDAAGKTWTSTFDWAGDTTSTTDPLGNKTTSTYDKNQRPATVVSARGNVTGANPQAYTTTFGYDANGNRTSITGPTGAVAITGYNEVNRPVSVTDPLGHKTTSTFNATGQVLTVTDPAAATASYTYDALGRLATATDTLGKTTTFGYDASSNRTSRTTPLGHKTTWSFDTDERLATVVDARGNAAGANPATYTTTFGYDTAGNRTTVKDPLGNTTTTAYDALNRPSAVTDPLGRKTSTVYDAVGRISTVTDPTGAVTTNGFNTVNDRTSRTDANNHTTTFTYDPLHRPATTTDALGHTTTYGYDPEGHNTTVTDGRGLTTTNSYDPRGLPTGSTYSDSTTPIAKVYDDAGRLATVTDATGTRTLTYDNTDQLRTITAPGGGTGFTYTYDTRGSVKSRTYPDGETLTYDYDDDGRQTQLTADGATTVYGYDDADNLTRTTLPAANGYIEARTYDTTGRISGIASTKGTTTLASWQLHRDNAGQLKSVDIKRANLSSGTENFTYDDAGRLTSGCPVTPNFTGCTAGTLTYTYDKVGNRKTQTDAYGTTTYLYDDTDQLSSSTVNSATTTYTYDNDGRTASATLPVNNRTISSGTTLTPGTVTASNNARLTMQADGNLVLSKIDTGGTAWSSGTSGHPGATATLQADGNLVVTDTTGTVLWNSNTAGNTGAIAKVQDDGNFVLYNTAGTAVWSSKTYRAALSNYVTTYTYDAAGNATTVVGKQTFTFTYDADGNRITTKTDGTLSNTLTWDVNNSLPQIATETNGSGGLIGDYTYDPLGLPQSQHNPSGTYYHHHDWLGSVTDLTNSTGTQQLRTGYDPFGQSGTATIATGAPTTPFGFAGQYNDPVIPGKQYLRAREYNTATGRFNSRDPLSTPASAPYGSAYSYAADAPTMYTDPSGMTPQDNDPSHMSNLEAIGSGLETGFKMPFEYIGDVYNAATGKNGGAGAFVDKYFPIRPAYAFYLAASKLREFGCNNVADEVDKNADELVQEFAVGMLGGIDSWAMKKFKARPSFKTNSEIVTTDLSQNIAQLGRVSRGSEPNLWDLEVGDRGIAFEEKMGMSNLRDGLKGFDHFDADTHTAISVKSLDTTRPSYQTAAAVFNRLKEGIDNARDYSGDHRYPLELPAGNINNRVVYVIVNGNNGLTAKQLAGMKRAEDYAHNNGVVLLFGSSTG